MKTLLTASLAILSVMASANVQEYKLDNGLEILVKEDHRAPVVVSQVWYKVGSGYEHKGITCISLALKHMMSTSTKQRVSGEFSRIIAESGRRKNAFTGADYTAYFQILESPRLPIMLSLRT